MPKRPSRRILVTGMHRSGTSLFSSWMRACGMFMGEDLIGASPSNRRGYSEDRQFVELFELLLKFNHTNIFYSDPGALAYSRSHLLLLSNLANERDLSNPQWSVKQPRAALFLDMWHAAVPDCYYIFILRDPLAVINSLLKRESNRFSYQASKRMGPALKTAFLEDRDHFAHKYAEAYVRTYREVLCLVGRRERPFLVVPFEQLRDAVGPAFRRLTRDWGFALNEVDTRTIYDEGIVTKESEYLVRDCEGLAEAKQLHQRLLDEAAASLG